MSKNNQTIKEVKEQSKKPFKKATKKLINWKEELSVWATVITALISIIQLIITLVKLSKE